MSPLPRFRARRTFAVHHAPYAFARLSAAAVDPIARRRSPVRDPIWFGACRLLPALHHGHRSSHKLCSGLRQQQLIVHFLQCSRRIADGGSYTQGCRESKSPLDFWPACAGSPAHPQSAAGHLVLDHHLHHHYFANMAVHAILHELDIHYELHDSVSFSAPGE